MDLRQGLLISAAIVGMFALLLIAVFGDKGTVDLWLLKQEKNQLMQRNARLEEKNLELHRAVNRLKKNDMGFIENIARQELGMVRDDEVILKLKNEPKRK